MASRRKKCTSFRVEQRTYAGDAIQVSELGTSTSSFCHPSGRSSCSRSGLELSRELCRCRNRWTNQIVKDFTSNWILNSGSMVSVEVKNKNFNGIFSLSCDSIAVNCAWIGVKLPLNFCMAKEKTNFIRISIMLINGREYYTEKRRKKK